MQTHFEKNTQVNSKDPIITIQAAELDENITQLLNYINRYESSSPNRLTIKTEDRLLMIRPAAIILADIVEAQLLLTTTEGMIKTNETLKHFLQRLANPNFVQISKHAVINLDHLLALSDSFSGSMSARLTGNTKTAVSRKYVKELMARLEM